jgi:hypothetical protein
MGLFVEDWCRLGAVFQKGRGFCACLELKVVTETSGFYRMAIGILELPLLASIDPDVRPCHNPLHEGQCHIRQGSMRFYIAGLMRVNAVRTGSIRISIRNRNPCKSFEHDQIFFSAVLYSQNPSGIDTGYDAGLYGWNRVDTVLIPYGPGSESGCVWLQFRNADFIVNCFDPFRPVWTCI